jgi:3-mercaptopyruvate sulfurtransferase SseA
MFNSIVASYTCFVLRIVYYYNEKVYKGAWTEHLNYGCKLKPNGKI